MVYFIFREQYIFLALTEVSLAIWLRIHTAPDHFGKIKQNAAVIQFTPGF